MSPAPRIRAKQGDVFRIPLSPTVCAYGQVVAKHGPEHLVVLFLDGPADFTPSVLRSGIRLAGIVFDAKLRNGDWEIVTSTSPVPIREPWFTSGHEALRGVRIENFDRSIYRPATPDEKTRHGHRFISSPMVLQLAAAAAEGLRPWQPELDHFRQLALEIDPSSRDIRAH